MEDNILNEDQLSEVKKTSDEKLTDGKAGIRKLINSFLKWFKANEKLVRILRIFLFIFIPLFVFIFILTFILYVVPALQEIKSGKKTEIFIDPALKKDAGYNKQIGVLVRDIQRLTRKYNTYSTGLSYIVINTTENRFYLYKNKKLIREGSCSTGSYKKLLTAEGKSWTFKTPRGKFTIQGKRTNPTWHKPDWAFVEEGIPIPPKDSPLRWEAGVLGDYAMDLGDSYMIHGTIYKRFLGMPVTHGCVRLNDEDLEVVFSTLNIGSKVYIY
jgi:lipoprotein-anchoring transpeptidase ErfK/SrfK